MTFEELLKDLDSLQDRLISQAKDKIGMDDYVAQISAYQHIINDHIKLSEAAARAGDDLEKRVAKLEERFTNPRETNL